MYFRMLVDFRAGWTPSWNENHPPRYGALKGEMKVGFVVLVIKLWCRKLYDSLFRWESI